MANEWIGKCFKKTETRSYPNWITSVYVYDVDIPTGKLKIITVNYRSPSNNEVEIGTTKSVHQDEIQIGKIAGGTNLEIPKEEFIKDYNKAMKTINDRYNKAN